LFSQQIIEELLSVAHVQAVAARAGVSISSFDKDFGVDGTFRQTIATGYWKYIDGGLSKNKTSVRIRISKDQELSPESLLRLMTCAREYSISGDWIC
jgi:hypothetical protein